MATVDAEPKAKIYWTGEEQATVLREAADLALNFPRLAPLQLVRMAQEKVLDEDRRRKIMSLAMANWTWFTDALPGAIAKARAAREAAKAPPPAPVEEAQEEPDIDLGQVRGRVDEMLLDGMAQSQAVQAKAQAQLHADLVDIAAGLNRIADLLGGGFALTPLGRLPAAVRAPEPPHGSLDEVDLATLARARSEGRLPAPVAAAPPPPAPRPIPCATRKPNVVVLSVGSGNTKGGIKKETEGHVGRLEFWDTPTRPVAGFANFDYIVATKWTPSTWVVEAKDGPWKAKVRSATGNAESIAKYIRSLPEVPVA